MSEEIKKELQERGFKIVSTWHVLLIIVGMLLTTGITIGSFKAQVNNIEARTCNLETWKSKREVSEQANKSNRDKQFHEIQLNLKQLLQKNGLKYERIEE